MSKASEIMARLDAVDVDEMLYGKASYAFLTLDELVNAILGDEERGCASFQQTFRDVREALRNAFAELEARAMPEGMKWPHYEDGEPVCIGNEVHIENEKPYPNFDMLLESITISSSGFSLTGADGEYVEFRADERVKRPKVLAADGEPLETGQTVWNVNNGMEFTVSRLPKPGEYQAVEVRYRNGSSTSFDPDQLTHQRPVLDADGVPIHEGDTVYLLSGEWCDRFPCFGFHGGEKLNVIDLNPKYKASGSIRCSNNGGWVNCYPQPSQLTHTKPEPPDSWERIEEDTGKSFYEYWGCEKVECSRCPALIDGKTPHEFFGCPYNCTIAMRRDIVRRCKALAERGE